MPDQTRDLTSPFRLFAPELAACGYCGAQPWTRCVMPDGRPRTGSGGYSNPHQVRWATSGRMWRRARFVVAVTDNDPRFGIAAGELFVAESYWLDPGAKVTLLARVTDGTDPSSNQYRHNVTGVRMATDADLALIHPDLR